MQQSTFHSKVSVFFTAVISVTLSHYFFSASSSSHQKSATDEWKHIPHYIQPLKTDWVVVRIESHPSEETLIFQHTSNGSLVRHHIAPKTTQKIAFPPGIFFAQTGSRKISIPTLIRKSKHDLDIIFPKHWPEPKSDFAWIPPGPVLIGDRTGVGAEDERPLRIEQFKGFWLAKTEVTNQQYANFLNQSETFEDRWIDLRSKKCGIKRKDDGTFAATHPNHPVVMISRYGADAYCQFLTKKTKIVHRLPTEWEWEKAAKGPRDLIYSYGNIYKNRQANQESGKLMRVGRFQPNDYGLFDMTGNAFEWTSSRFDPNLKTDEFNQSLRGGSYVLDGSYLRNSFRMKQSPDVMTDDFGFRVLRQATAKDIGKR